MRIPFISTVTTSLFDNLQTHTEKVKECGWAFQQAIECQFSDRCERFEALCKDISELARDADDIKSRVRKAISKGSLLPVDKFQLLRYLREQNSILDALKYALSWVSFRLDPGVPNPLRKDFILFIDAVVDPIDELGIMMKAARKNYKNRSKKNRVMVEEIVDNLRIQKQKADILQNTIINKVLHMEINPVTLFHVIRLAEALGAIADHAENAGDTMSVMVGK